MSDDWQPGDRVRFASRAFWTKGTRRGTVKEIWSRDRDGNPAHLLIDFDDNEGCRPNRDVRSVKHCLPVRSLALSGGSER